MFWSPLFVLLSIAFDVYFNWADVAYRTLAITASLGWLLYWDALNDLQNYEREDDANS